MDVIVKSINDPVDDMTVPVSGLINCVILKCYSSEKLIALSTLHEVVITWYSFYSRVDRSNADNVSCSRTQHTEFGI